MKIRADFVTNSSSANYILELSMVNEKGKQSNFDLAVSPETCFSDDGDMTAEDIYLIPSVKDGEICFADQSLSSKTTIEELASLLFGAARIDGWAGRIKDPDGSVLEQLLAEDDTDEEDDDDDDFDDDDDDDEDYDEDDGISVTVSQVAPKTIAKFIKTCRKRKITPENLKTIIIRNEKSGSGDSAIFFYVADLLSGFDKYCKENGLDKSQDTLHKLVDFVKSEPVVEVSDNEYTVDGEHPCVWESSDSALKSTMKEILDGNRSRDYFMATFAREYIVDVKHNSVKSREIVLFGSL